MSFNLVVLQSHNPEGHGSKPHFIPDSLLTDAVAELCIRFKATVYLSEARTEGLVDLPGMIMVDRTYEEFKLDDSFTLSIPTTDIGYYLGELERSPLRKVNGNEYYKLHGWIHCVMLTPAMRDKMIEQIKSNLVDIEAKIESQNLEFDRRMAQINKDRMVIITPPRSMPLDKKLN